MRLPEVPVAPPLEVPDELEPGVVELELPPVLPDPDVPAVPEVPDVLELSMELEPLDDPGRVLEDEPLGDDELDEEVPGNVELPDELVSPVLELELPLPVVPLVPEPVISLAPLVPEPPLLLMPLVPEPLLLMPLVPEPPEVELLGVLLDDDPLGLVLEDELLGVSLNTAPLPDELLPVVPLAPDVEPEPVVDDCPVPLCA